MEFNAEALSRVEEELSQWKCLDLWRCSTLMLTKWTGCTKQNSERMLKQKLLRMKGEIDKKYYSGHVNAHVSESDRILEEKDA